MLKETEKILLAAILFLLLARIFIITAGNYAGDSSIYDTSSNPQSKEIIELTNSYRQSIGLNQLAINPRLTQAAVNKAKDILAGGYFNHSSPTGRKFSDWIKEVGYTYFYVGENLAIDFQNSQDTFEAWLKSETHRRNLEQKEFQETGVAAINGNYDGRKTTVIVQLFGTRALAENLTIENALLPRPLIKTDEAATDFQKPLKAAGNFFDLMLIICAPLFLLVLWINKPKNQKNIGKIIIADTSNDQIKPTATLSVSRPKSPGTKQKPIKNAGSNNPTKLLSPESRLKPPSKNRPPIIPTRRPQ